ncbi:hypothetical protein PVK06_026706 [Gossypium arboreum]|uniref:Uncharacterized protein n=1 Tax=Gossypium arboreum TaxID=29729 RepID=A0ABR0P0W1_GOSAR|nr:hypothetical protein PVK06_026706 [Gossypium arboreum]
MLIAANVVEGPQFQLTDGSFCGGRSYVRGRGHSFRLRIQCQIYSRYNYLPQRCYYRYNCDEQSPLEAPVVRRGGFASRTIRRDWARDDQLGATAYGQNWGTHGQNWRPYFWPNFGMDNYVPRGPHAGNGHNGSNPFVQNGNGQHDIDDPNFYPYGREFNIRRNAMGLQFSDIP